VLVHSEKPRRATRWDRLASRYDEHLPSSQNVFDAIGRTITRLVQPTSTDIGLDLGSGTGFLTIPLAERIALTYAVDASQPMLDRLSDKLRSRGLRVRARRADLRGFVPPQGLDVIVSNYALHHLSHPGKRALAARCAAALNPGGRMAVGDVMVPLTIRPGEHQLLLRKIRRLVSQGATGYWKLADRAIRQVAGRGEYPASREFWLGAMRDAGLVDVSITDISPGSAIVFGRKTG
jgi:trans-aconitate methyltransferase